MLGCIFKLPECPQYLWDKSRMNTKTTEHLIMFGPSTHFETQSQRQCQAWTATNLHVVAVAGDDLAQRVGVSSCGKCVDRHRARENAVHVGVRHCQQRAMSAKSRQQA